RFTAAVTQGPIERYVVYAVPLLLLALVVAYRRITLRDGLVAAGLLAALLLTLSPVWNYLEQPALFGTTHRLASIGFSEQHIGGVALFALIAGLLGVWLLARGRLVLLLALVFAGMLVQAQMSQKVEKDLLAGARPTFAPPHLDWVARVTRKPVAALNINGPVQLRGTVNFYTELFSPNVTSFYSTVDTSKITGTCPTKIDGRGFLVAPPGSCSKWPRYVVYQAGGPYLAHFYGQKLLADAGRSGRLLQVGPGAPRLMSLIGTPCQPTGCENTMEVGAFVDSPGVISLTFGAPAEPVHLTLGKRVYTFKPGRQTKIDLPVRPNEGVISFAADWTDPAGAPPLLSATLQQGPQVTNLL
ncbi:MAG TPA: hypothetical protein VFT42_09520, partial [Solirubrobacteraceae bacterium]|nr:hypothetical protein [Solirubrobacteraceae bacterium]